MIYVEEINSMVFLVKFEPNFCRFFLKLSSYISSYLCPLYFYLPLKCTTISFFKIACLIHAACHYHAKAWAPNHPKPDNSWPQKIRTFAQERLKLSVVMLLRLTENHLAYWACAFMFCFYKLGYNNSHNVGS